MSNADCIFCKVLAGEIPSEVVDSDERTIAFMDINPATPGHCLVIPREHSEDIFEVSDEDLQATAVASQRLALKLKQALGAEGVNVLNCSGKTAWQTVWHYHVHVIPRHENDPLKLPWLPREGDPKSIAKVALRIRVSNEDR